MILPFLLVLVPLVVVELVVPEQHRRIARVGLMALYVPAFLFLIL
ncbi:MAG: hypothetical protein ABMA25_18575 [Ilumatobacteraceae bacterium]